MDTRKNLSAYTPPGSNYPPYVSINMPNHVINELIIRTSDAGLQQDILANAVNTKGEIDFGILVPIPLNVWLGSVGQKHEKAFKQVALDWCRLNWGTKWNAYGLNQGGRYQSVAQTADSITLTFQTAWGPPYGWIVAVFNRFKLPMEHRWLDEGCESGVVGKFDWAHIEGVRGEPWEEEPADNAMQKHLHKLLWGVEEFPPDEDEAA